MLRDRPYDWPVITADELRDARNRAGYTSQAALAKALGVSERTVTNWEQEGSHVSVRAEAKVRTLLWPSPGPLSSYSNYELLSELGRRLDFRPPNYTEDQSEDNYLSSNSRSGNAVNDESGINAESPAPGGARGDDTHKSGPRRIRGRGPR